MAAPKVQIIDPTQGSAFLMKVDRIYRALHLFEERDRLGMIALIDFLTEHDMQIYLEGAVMRNAIRGGLAYPDIAILSVGEREKLDLLSHRLHVQANTKTPLELDIRKYHVEIDDVRGPYFNSPLNLDKKFTFTPETSATERIHLGIPANIHLGLMCKNNFEEALQDRS